MQVTSILLLLLCNSCRADLCNYYKFSPSCFSIVKYQFKLTSIQSSSTRKEEFFLFSSLSLNIHTRDDKKIRKCFKARMLETFSKITRKSTSPRTCENSRTCKFPTLYFHHFIFKYFTSNFFTFNFSISNYFTSITLIPNTLFPITPFPNTLIPNTLFPTT